MKKTNNKIIIQEGSFMITITTIPYVKAVIEFHHPDWKRLAGTKVTDAIFDLYGDTIIDEADICQETGRVRLTWHHCHFYDLSYNDHRGYFITKIARPQFFWDYALFGPAQTYLQAIELIQLLGVS